MTDVEDLARRLNTVAHQSADSRTERDRLIREAHNAGMSLREIERAIDGLLTHVGIKRIIDRNT